MDGRISNTEQIAYLRRYTMTEGKAEGLKIIEGNTGAIRFLLNESKALDIAQLWYQGVNISFLSKNGLSKSERPFLNRFEGGMLYTCGLDSVGGRDGFELHGTLHNIPAKITVCRCNGQEIEIEGELSDCALFGKNLFLKRRITAIVGGESLKIEDVLINKGTAEENYCLLYHVNLGYPFLDEGVTIKSDVQSVIPRTGLAKERIGERTVFLNSVANEEERCYFIKNKTPHIEAVNHKLGIKFALDYSDDTLPYLVQWNSNASGDYALGLEPCTTFLDDQFTYSKLRVGERKSFSLTLSFKMMNLV